MLSHRISKWVSVILLMVVTLGTTSSALGEMRSHGLPSLAHSISHHAHSHHHVDDEEINLHHDASNHNHVYDTGNIKPQHQVSFAHLSQSRFIMQTNGMPIRKPFKIERPPRLA